MTLRRLFLPLLALCLLLPVAGWAQDAKKGREIALAHCSRCHVLPDSNAFGGIGSTPSFKLLANLDDGLERFDSFFERRPHPSVIRLPGVAPPSDQEPTTVPIELQPSDIDDLVAYAKTLRDVKD